MISRPRSRFAAPLGLATYVILSGCATGLGSPGDASGGSAASGSGGDSQGGSSENAGGSNQETGGTGAGGSGGSTTGGSGGMIRAGGAPGGTGGAAGMSTGGATATGGAAGGPGFDGGVGRCGPAGIVQKTLPAGTWTNVTPATKASTQGGTLDSTISYSGAQDVVVDPVRPSDLYVVMNYLGLWKSTDYGLTWAKVNTGTNGAIIDTGKTWTLGIDPSCSRDRKKPPTLYTTNWASIDIDPYDSQHLLIGYHEELGLSESFDGCATWKAIPAAPVASFSTYPFFIDTGDAAGTRKTWLLIGQGGGMYRTTDAGATITMVDPLTHAHGSTQIFQAGAGVIYAPGSNGSQGNGVYRSTDYGATWKRVNNGAVQNAVYATPNYIYADYGWSCIDCTVGQTLQRASREPGTAWSKYMETPTVMQIGAKRAAVTFDGANYIIVTGNRNNGILRYVE